MEEKFEWADKYITLFLVAFFALLNLFSYPSMEYIEEWNCDYIIKYSYTIHFLISYLCFYLMIQIPRVILALHVLLEYLLFKAYKS